MYTEKEMLHWGSYIILIRQLFEDVEEPFSIKKEFQKWKEFKELLGALGENLNDDE